MPKSIAKNTIKAIRTGGKIVNISNQFKKINISML
jgi:starvation-inducible outer membrane lipoprotein